MTILAEFLEAHEHVILELFTRRVQAKLAPIEPGRAWLVDHVPTFLRALGRALADREWSPERDQAAHAAAHGPPPLHLGFDVDAVVHAYGLLSDCIFELLERSGVTPGLRELRILSQWIAAATADSVSCAGAEPQLGLFQQAPGFVCFLRGPELRFELANAAYVQLVGHREILGKSLREALPELAGQGYFELMERVYASGEPFVGRGMRVQLQREPDAPLSDAAVDFMYQPIRDAAGRVTGILAQGYEVTEAKQHETRRQRAEAALRASEERYRTLFDSIDDGFCLLQMIFDEHDQPVDYRFIEANPAFARQTGLLDAVGRRVRELVPDLDRAWFQRYGHVAVTGEPARFESYAPAMGRWFDVFASRAGPPELRQVAIVFKDVSERKHAEEERARLFELERAARRDAEEANRLRDEFLATVSHELRTPLTSILGWVQMLRIGNLPPDKHDRAIETIERNARAQAQLIEDLLDVSSVLAGKLQLDIKPVDIAALVEAALETVRPTAEARGISLQATLPAAGTIPGDARRLEQVVWNLLSNAIKFTPRGGSVHAHVERLDTAVEITVTDTGRGIAADFQSHVFENFRQADGATTRSHGGLGLGLAIVRQLVELHGGSVSVYSEGEGRGATFTVLLPLAPARPGEPGSPPPLQPVPSSHDLAYPPDLAGLHLLVVDDEADTREMLRALLEQCGARVRLAASAADAMAQLTAEPPDLLVSDIGMPGEDGYALIRKLRGLPPEAGGDTPAVALTAYARSGDRARALLAGFNNHLAKPVEPTELLAAIVALAPRPPRGPAKPQ